MWGARTALPLLGGVALGVLLASMSFPPEEEEPTVCPQARVVEPIDDSADWIVNQDKPAQTPQPDAKPQSPQVVRARFAATELGIRDKLLVLVWAETGGLAVALNTTLAKHVSRLIALADTARLDLELSSMPSLIPFRANGLHAHTHILNAIFNHTLQENYDWFLFVKESTYVNPFELQRLITKMSWHEKVAMGSPDSTGRCDLDGGVLLSNPAMQMLVQQRHSCNAILAQSEQLAMEMCIYAATNLTCKGEHQGRSYAFWHVSGGEAAHDAVNRWTESPDFNSSLAVGPLLSEADARALHDHFVKVEIARVEKEITELEEEVDTMTEDLPEGPSWPPGVHPYSKAPNRYQVPVMEFFTAKEIFKNEANQNVRPLEGNDKTDVDQVIAAAREYVEKESANRSLSVEFVQLRGGYRVFDSQRGMDYVLDLLYRDTHTEESMDRRVHLTRAIDSTRLMQQVPYVKEDADLTIVVPVAEEAEVLPARRLLARQARLCTASNEESRHTRVVVGVSGRVERRSATFISNDLEELKRRCKRSSLETAILVVDDSSSLHAAEALSEAVDHFGPHSMFLLLSPHADIQKEFLDRARINTIKKFQVFLPIPFVEYHPTIAGMDIPEGEAVEDQRDAALARLRDTALPQRKKQLVVQKEHGRFDPLDFSVVCVYGTDYMSVRSYLNGGKRLDVGSAFLHLDNVHTLRAVEPALRLRYHSRECDPDLVEEDLARCTQANRENLAAKDELARLVFKPEP